MHVDLTSAATQPAIATFSSQSAAGVSFGASSPDAFAAAMQAQDSPATGLASVSTQSASLGSACPNLPGSAYLSCSLPTSAHFATVDASAARSAVATADQVQSLSAHEGAENIGTPINGPSNTPVAPAVASSIPNAVMQQLGQSRSRPLHAAVTNTGLVPSQSPMQATGTCVTTCDASVGSDTQPIVGETFNTADSVADMPHASESAAKQAGPLPADDDNATAETDPQADVQPRTASKSPGRGAMVKAHTAVRKAADDTPATTEAKAPAAGYAAFTLVEVASPLPASPQDKPVGAAGAPPFTNGQSGKASTATVLGSAGTATPMTLAAAGNISDETAKDAATHAATTAVGNTQEPAVGSIEEDQPAGPAWTGVHAFSERGLDATAQLALAPTSSHGASFTHSMGANGSLTHGALTHADILAAVDGSRSIDTDGATQAVTRPLQRLDIAIDDPSLGALNVRAELRNGTLHASLSGVTEGLSNSAPALQQFLQEHRIGVHTVSFSERSESTPRSVAGATTVSDSAMTYGGDRGSSSDRQSEQPSRRSVTPPTLGDPRLSPVPQHSSVTTYQPAGGFYNSSSSTTVSIHI